MTLTVPTRRTAALLQDLTTRLDTPGERLIVARTGTGIGSESPDISGSRPWPITGPTPHLSPLRGAVQLS